MGLILLPFTMLGVSVAILKTLLSLAEAGSLAQKAAVTMISILFDIFFFPSGTPCYLEYMRIWQRSTFSSPVFLSHHLFGCARIHWNVFTRCQNSGNSTLFGSREGKDKVIMGVLWKSKSGGVSATITEAIYSVAESKGGVTSPGLFLIKVWEWMPRTLPRSSMKSASRDAAR